MTRPVRSNSKAVVGELEHLCGGQVRSYDFDVPYRIDPKRRYVASRASSRCVSPCSLVTRSLIRVNLAPKAGSRSRSIVLASEP
jgi:hypothetical protein